MRRATAEVVGREVGAWRCRAFGLVPSTSMSSRDVRVLEAEVRSLEAELDAKRRALIGSVAAHVKEDVGRV